MTRNANFTSNLPAGGWVRTAMALAFCLFASPSPAPDFGQILDRSGSHDVGVGVQLGGNASQNPQGEPAFDADQFELSTVQSMFVQFPNAYLDAENQTIGGAGQWRTGVRLLPCAMECMANEQCLSFNYVPSHKACRQYTANRFSSSLKSGPMPTTAGSVTVEHFSKNGAEAAQQAALVTQDFQNRIAQLNPLNCINALDQQALAANGYDPQAFGALCQGTETFEDAGICANQFVIGAVPWDARAVEQSAWPNDYTRWTADNIVLTCKGVRTGEGANLPYCVTKQIIAGQEWSSAVRDCRYSMANE